MLRVDYCELRNRDFFITQDSGQVFQVIEDERGDCFWGYGHREKAEFVGEINRWLRHVGILEHDLLDEHERITHLWAVMVSEERFEFASADDANAFPITRLIP